MMKREEIEAALFEAEGHVDAAIGERDRLLRHLGAELGVTSERKVRELWNETKAARAGSGPAPDPAKVASCVAMIGSLGSPDAIEAHLGVTVPAVRESSEVRTAVAARLDALTAKARG